MNFYESFSNCEMMKRPAIGFSMMAQTMEENVDKVTDGLALMPDVAEQYVELITNLASYAKHFINRKNNDTSNAAENIQLFDAAIKSLSDDMMDKVERFMHIGKY